MDGHPLSRYEVCLVGTSNPENLGSVARIMANFGFERLTLVAPRLEALAPRALVVACGARESIERARVVGSFEEAIGEATLVVGSTARRGDRRPTIPPRALALRLRELGSDDRVALVFGPEDRGLTAAEIDRCDLVTHIPTRGPLASLNLAQAVAVVLWEISQADAGAPAPRRAATRGEIDGLVEHAAEVLEAIGYFVTAPRDRALTELRRALVQAGLKPEQVRSLRGVCRQALWALRRGATSSSPSDGKSR